MTFYDAFIDELEKLGMGRWRHRYKPKGPDPKVSRYERGMHRGVLRGLVRESNPELTSAQIRTAAKEMESKNLQLMRSDYGK